VATDVAARPRATQPSTSSTVARTTTPTTAKRATTTTEPTVATTVPVTTATEREAIDDPGCATATDLVVSASAVRALGGAAEQLDAMAAAVDVTRPHLADAGPTTRSLLEQLVAYVDESRAAGVAARSTAQNTGDPATQLLTDQLILQVHGMLLNPLVMRSSFEGTDECPELSEIGTAADAIAVDPLADIRATRDQLVARGHGDIADTYLPEEWYAAADRDMTVALSGMQAEYDRCAVDPGAAAYGDNPGCDALYDACDVRNLLACNDLFWVALPESAYEHFAATCGERVPIGDPAWAGYCEQLD
jgi:hypothetical protein